MTRNPPYSRETALNAATELFQRKGYHATSLKDLEAALNMRPGSIYAAFKSKENLFLLALNHYADQQHAAQAARLADGRGGLAAMTGHVRAIADACAQGEHAACFLVNTLLEATPDEAHIKAHTQTLMRRIEAMFRDTFQHAQDAGEVGPDKDPAAMAQWYQRQVFGLRVLTSLADDQAEVYEAAEQIVRGIEAHRCAA